MKTGNDLVAEQVRYSTCFCYLPNCANQHNFAALQRIAVLLPDSSIGCIDSFLSPDWDGSSDCKYDSERGKYYKGTPKAIEVTDEEYAEICKVCPEGGINVQTKIETGAESTLTAIAICYLVAGGIGSILLFTIGIVASNISYIVGSIVCLMNTLLVWALLRCISNMSITLKQIKNQISL